MNNRTRFVNYLSPAKLNLGLKVIGKRDDGYHLLNTIFCLIDLFDQIQIQVLAKEQISLVEHNQAWHFSTDLAYKAAKLLQQESGCTLGANIKVKKVIPSGAGLGGGSSNAATVLIALNHLWGINWDTNKLIELGRKLGADVPFFIYGKNAFATGIGDIFSEINIPESYFILIKPDFQIPTKRIFANIEKFSDEVPSPESLLLSLDNDLQDIAIKLYPALTTIIEDLSAYGKIVMTGSGSTLYLHFSDLKSANKVAHEIGKRYNTYLVKTINQSPVFAISC